MRYLTAIGLMALSLTLVPSMARADATYTFTVTVALKNLSKTLNGQPLRYFVECQVTDVNAGVHITNVVDIATGIDTQGNYSGKLGTPLVVVSPLAGKSYQCMLRANQNQAWISDANANAAIWDPLKSKVLASGPIQ